MFRHFITRPFAHISQLAIAIVLGLTLGLGIQAAIAWTPAPGSPPAGNVKGPITTGLGQLKDGALVLNSAFTVDTSTPFDGIPDAYSANGLIVANGRVGFGMVPASVDPNVRVEVNGKILSASTQASDAGNTVVTKDYLVDAAGGTNSSGFPVLIYIPLMNNYTEVVGVPIPTPPYYYETGNAICSSFGLSCTCVRVDTAAVPPGAECSAPCDATLSGGADCGLDPTVVKDVHCDGPWYATFDNKNVEVQDVMCH